MLYLDRLQQELSEISPQAAASHASVRDELERRGPYRLGRHFLNDFLDNMRRFSAYVSDVTGRQSEVIESLRATIASSMTYALGSSEFASGAPCSGYSCCRYPACGVEFAPRVFKG